MALFCYLSPAVYAQKFIQLVAPPTSTNVIPPSVTAAGNQLFFVAQRQEVGLELWKSDGTRAGTKPVIANRPGYAAGPSQLVSYQGKVYFRAYDAMRGTQLWTSDGTEAGTRVVKQIAVPSLYGSDPSNLVVMDNYLYFAAKSDGSFYDLWRSDGTEEGTVLVKKFGSYSGLSQLIPIDGTLYFTVGATLWQSDGTDQGTQEVEGEGINGHLILDLYNADGALYFTTNTTYRENIKLWKIPAKGAAPVLIKEYQEPLYGDQDMGNFTYLKGNLYFSVRTAYDAQTDTDVLWKTDGTSSGTVVVKSFEWNRHEAESHMQGFVAFKDRLFFRGNARMGYTLWQSDGTGAGTVQLSIVGLGSTYNIGTALVQSDGLLYFVGSGYDVELWRTDGTVPGTELFSDINAKSGSSPSNLVDINGVLYFTANDGKGVGLWSNQPAPQLTVRGLDNGDSPAVNFGTGPIDGKTERKITLANSGKGTLTLGDVSTSGNAFQVKEDFPRKLSPGESKGITLLFYPSTSGDKKGKLTIESDDENTPSYQVSLSGKAENKVARQDFEALVALYKATNGDQWYAKKNWNIQSNTVSNEWQGVSVENGRVVQLTLSYNNLSGMLPKEVDRLTALKILKLDHNQLTGGIPREIGKLANLEELWLWTNQLTGSIPKEVANLSRLKILAVGYNLLTGSLPLEIGQLATTIEQFQVNNNRLEGKVPEALANCRKLRSLQIESNRFTSMPDLSALGSQSYLTITAQDNQLTFRDIGPNIQLFRTKDSYAPQKAIGTAAYYSLNDQVTTINMALPASLVDTRHTYQWTRDGTDIAGATQSTYVLTGANSSGEATYSCRITNPEVVGLTLQRANIYVQQPVSEDEFNALVAFYNATGGTTWTNRDNWNRSQNTVSNLWYGLKVEGGHVKEIDFTVNGNNLKGNLPAELGKLSNLEKLSLNGNPALTGPIPSEIGNLKDLSVLSLARNRLTSGIPDGIGQLKKLSILNLGSNQLTGTMPTGLFSSPQLSQLNLAENLLNGPVPAEIDQAVALSYLDLSSNQLSGSIPAQLGSLTQLQFLLLNSNRLTGTLPEALSSLPKLQYLYLNNNQLTGSVPNGFSKATSRYYSYQFNISNNQLTNLPKFEKPANQFYYPTLEVANNQFTFEDLEPNAGLLKNFSPQDSVGSATTVLLVNSQPIVMELPHDLGGVHNRYQWTKNGVELFEATQPAYVIPNTGESVAGKYSCRITNTEVPGLTLYRRAIWVQPANAVIPGLSISNTIVPENKALGTLVGTLSPLDNRTTFALATGTGSEDNSSFTLEGNHLRTARVFDFEQKNTYRIRISANSAGKAMQVTFTIQVFDTPEELPVELAPCRESFQEFSGTLNALSFSGDSTVFAVGNIGTILKSGDAGESWQMLKSGTQANLIAIRFTSSQIGYALGEYGVILKTSDGGTNWSNLDIGNEGFFSSFYFLNDEVGYVIGQYGALLKTLDGGKHWEDLKFSSDGYNAVFFTNEHTGYLGGPSNTLLKTTDGGKHWSPLNTDFLGFNGRVYALYFTNENTGYLTSGSGLYQTTDAGQTWVNPTINGNITGLNQIYFSNSQTGYVLGNWSSAALMKTENAGQTWEVQDIGFLTPRAVGFNRAGNKGCIVGAGPFAGTGTSTQTGRVIYRTADAGRTWKERSYLDESQLTSVFFVDDNNGYVMGAGLSRTRDAGMTWQPTSVGLPINPTDIFFTDINTGYAVGRDDQFVTVAYKTTNGGDSWQKLRVRDDYEGLLERVYFVDGTVGFIIDGKKDLYKTTDAGKTWRTIAIDEGYFLRDLYFTDARTGYLVGYGHIFKTTDAGETWQKMYDNNDSLLFTVWFTDPQTGYAGGNNGLILKTTDAGNSWQKIITGIDWHVIALKFRNQSEGIAVCTNYNSSGTIYQTKDGGLTWVHNGHPSGKQLFDIAITPNGTAYVVGDTGTLLKSMPGETPTLPSYIEGETTVCTQALMDYRIRATQGVAHHWSVSDGGFITASGNIASVKWLTAGTHTVSVAVTNGCGISVAREQQVVVYDQPSTLIAGADSVSLQDTTQYLVANRNGNRYRWEVEGGHFFNSTDTSQVTVIWDTPGCGTITVTETVEATGCRRDSTLYVTVSDTASYYMLTGNVFTHAGKEVTKATVLLYQKYGDVFKEEKQLSLSASNQYEFKGLTTGQYTIKVMPDTDTYPSSLATYAGNASTLAEAEIVQIKGSLMDKSIVLLEKASSEGKGRINGLLVKGEGFSGGRVEDGKRVNAGEPIPNTSIFLVENEDHLVYHVITDQRGEFEFNNLPDGSYTLLVDYKGIPMSANNSSLSIADQSIIELTAIVSDQQITTSVHAITGVEPAEAVSSIKVYPNPTTNLLHVGLEGPWMGDVAIRLTDLLGKVHVSSHLQKTLDQLHTVIQVESLPSGMYILEIAHKKIRLIKL